MTFRTTIELGGKTATGIRVPPEVVDALGAGKKPAVTVTIGGYSYRSTIAVMGGAFMIPFSAEHRAATGLAAGDDIEVSLALDTAPRVVEIPDDFAAALTAAPVAKQRFEKLSYSHQRQHTLAIADAKTPETRARRIAKAISTLEST
jgi:hypothetical protein